MLSDSDEKANGTATNSESVAVTVELSCSDSDDSVVAADELCGSVIIVVLAKAKGCSVTATTTKIDDCNFNLKGLHASGGHPASPKAT